MFWALFWSGGSMTWSFVCSRRGKSRYHNVKVHFKNSASGIIYFPPSLPYTHHQWLFLLPTCSHNAQSFFKWEVSLIQKMFPINHFFWEMHHWSSRTGSLDDLQLLAINASSDLWPPVLRHSSFEPPSMDRSERGHIDLSRCWLCSLVPAALLLHVLQVFICKRTFTLAFLISGCQGCHSCSSSTATDELRIVTL